MSSRPCPVCGDPHLTPREYEVIQALCAGDGRLKDVAQRLGMTPKTVETHRANVYRKLEVHTIVELFRWALRNGVVKPEC